MVHDVHLFILHIHANSFGAGWQGEMELLFSVWHCVGRLSTDYGSRILQSFILIDALSSACWKKKKRERNRQGAFFHGSDMTCWI
jgi:hypothetical protein